MILNPFYVPSLKSIYLCLHFSGLEAPRNSLELPLETSNGLRTLRDDLQVSKHCLV